jgi:hypothetical protein
MQQVVEGYRGLGLLIDVNNDRLLSIVVIAAAMAAVGWVGVEYAFSFMVQDVVTQGAAYL